MFIYLSFVFSIKLLFECLICLFLEEKKLLQEELYLKTKLKKALYFSLDMYLPPFFNNVFSTVITDRSFSFGIQSHYSPWVFIQVLQHILIHYRELK